MIKKILIFATTAILLLTTFITVAADGYDTLDYGDNNFSYIYSQSHNGKYVVPSPSVYIPNMSVDTTTLGVKISNPQHITNDNEGNFYIVNTGENNIVVTDSKFNFKESISGFVKDGEAQTFSSPYGCYITDDGTLYVADTGNKRIVILNPDRTLKSIILRPESEVLDKGFVFEPQKIAVDSSGRVFVVAKGAFEGIMQFYSDGSFIGYIGSISVEADPLEIMWKKLLTSEQASKRQQFIPVTYTNLFLDNEEFLYTVSLSQNTSTPIRRLNLGGGDILMRNALTDIDVAGDTDPNSPSQFVAICASDNGIYYAADSTKSRIFIYDEDGNMLCAFGGPNADQKGTFKNISSLMLYDGNLIVSDSKTSKITVMKPTEYMNEIIDGIVAYRTGDYKNGKVFWERVIAQNSNFDLAYSKLGMIENRLGNTKKAMEYFKIAYDRDNYSKAYKKFQKEWFTNNLTTVLTVAAGVVVLATVLVVVKNKRRGKNA